ncbi:hypothetical protein BJ508DRAFT_378814 [Ascobolus immersus RN42]|uniref:Uncharacterized protein n=1 Tax=Ascobolus immersus RN42 TaxID=1160509 RepID=A0A3N4I0D6_ASCIM|nr:hypothetical protein BJ508DRAFT_378814 [Ascobolus immersus RN42]
MWRCSGFATEMWELECRWSRPPELGIQGWMKGVVIKPWVTAFYETSAELDVRRAIKEKLLPGELTSKTLTYEPHATKKKDPTDSKYCINLGRTWGCVTFIRTTLRRSYEASHEKSEKKHRHLCKFYLQATLETSHKTVKEKKAWTSIRAASSVDAGSVHAQPLCTYLDVTLRRGLGQRKRQHVLYKRWGTARGCVALMLRFIRTLHSKERTRHTAESAESLHDLSRHHPQETLKKKLDNAARIAQIKWPLNVPSWKEMEEGHEHIAEKPHNRPFTLTLS